MKNRENQSNKEKYMKNHENQSNKENCIKNNENHSNSSFKYNIPWRKFFSMCKIMKIYLIRRNI